MDREERIVPPEGNPASPAGEAGRAMLARMNAGAHEELAEWGLGLCLGKGRYCGATVFGGVSLVGGLFGRGLDGGVGVFEC